MKNFGLLFLSSLLILSLTSAGTAPPDFTSGKIVDLSHPFDADAVYWPTAEGFKLEKDFEGVTEKGFSTPPTNSRPPSTAARTLTRPCTSPKGATPWTRFRSNSSSARAWSLTLRSNAEGNRDYQVTADDFLRWEKANGQIPKGAIVILRTGYAKFWPDRKRYMGTDERGAAAVPKLHFPGLHPDAARWLTSNRSVKAVGLDTPSIDYGQSTLFESHRVLFNKNVPAFENLDNLDQLPVKNFTVVALPMKIKGGSGGPLRAIAILKEKR